MEIKDFKDLEVWQDAHELTKEIYEISANFPIEEKYVLTSQIRRCASSVPANIVEGFEREHTREYIQFLNIAKGSLAETRYFLLLAFELGYFDSIKYEFMEKKYVKLRHRLGALINSLRKGKQF